jgi:hypothetical protein
MAKIYLDACALNRLTDDQRQPRIRTEAEAVEKVLHLIWKGETEWMASIVLGDEIRRNPNREGRNDALKLISLAGGLLRPHDVSIERARTLEALGYGAFDCSAPCLPSVTPFVTPGGKRRLCVGMMEPS